MRVPLLVRLPSAKPDRGAVLPVYCSLEHSLNRTGEQAMPETQPAADPCNALDLRPGGYALLVHELSGVGARDCNSHPR